MTSAERRHPSVRRRPQEWVLCSRRVVAGVGRLAARVCRMRAREGLRACCHAGSTSHVTGDLLGCSADILQLDVMGLLDHHK